MNRKLRRAVFTVLPSLMVMFVVVSLLLFFFVNKPNAVKKRAKIHNRDETSINHLKDQHDTEYILKEPEKRPVNDEKGSSKKGSGVKKVIVVSTARSGSSWTGDILSRAGNDVYYVFEPLRHSMSVMWKRHQAAFAFEQGRIHEDWKQKARDTLTSFLSCDFRKFDLTDLDHLFLERNSKTSKLAKCVQQVKTSMTDDPAGHIQAAPPNPGCLQEAKAPCQKAKVIVLKVIRLGVLDLEPLLESDPDLSLVMLVRDPRASLLSRLTVFNESFPRGPSSLFSSTCNALENDVSALLQLHQRFPKRVTLLHYETLAERPLEAFDRLYQFLGLKWTTDAKAFVQGQIPTSKVKVNASARLAKFERDPYSVVRGNSSVAANAWRTYGSWTFVKMVQRYCFGVMRQLGYRLFRLKADFKNNSTESVSLLEMSMNDSVVLK